MLMSALFGLYPFLLKLYADSGYQGPKFQQGLKRVRDQINVEIVKRSDLGNSSCCPGAGSSNGRLAGSTGAAAWPRIGKSQPERSGISTLGVHPADGQKALSDHNMIPDGLSGNWSTGHPTRLNLSRVS